MKNALRQLLDDLDAVGEVHEEVGDTDVREAMWEAVHKLLVRPQADYRLPQDFRMFSDEGNAAVARALGRFFAHPEVARAAKLPTPGDRLAAFQDGEVQSVGQRYYDDYFGWSDQA